MIQLALEIAATRYYGKKITEARYRYNRYKDRVVYIAFADGTAIEIGDDYRICCEHRYLTSDDDLSTLVGNKLVKIEIKDGPTEEEEEGCDIHETAFLEITTDRSHVIICTHNEHNGYYGGFNLSLTEV